MMVKLHKKIRTAAVLSVLVGGLALSGIAAAFGETTPTGVEIQAISLLDTASDVVGSVDFTPEGNKDGHFKLTLKLAQKTTINAVVLRSTDAYGKDNYQGVWRTNRATTGWLLGIMQGDDVVNPGFRKDVKEPVGTFEGSLNWDLYASNNGTIKETQYYVLEIETAQGTVSSKPFIYQKPQSGGSTPAATPAPTQSPTPTQPPASTPTPAPTQSPASTPTQQPTPSQTPATPAAKPLIVRGGLGEIRIQQAAPLEYLTLVEKQGDSINVLGYAPVDGAGMSMFAKVPYGTDYYVYTQTGDSYGPIRVDLPFMASRNIFQSPVTFNVTYNKFNKLFHFETFGKVADGVTQITIQWGDYTEKIPVVDKSFSRKSSVANPGWAKVVAVTGDGPNGPVTMYIKVDDDLINDPTVEALPAENPGSWQIKGVLTAPYDKTTHILNLFQNKALDQALSFVQDTRLIGKVQENSIDEQIKKQALTDFEMTYEATAPNQPKQAIYVLAADHAGKFEFLAPWPLAAERPLTGSIQLRIDSTKAVITGKEQTLEVAPFFHEGRTMVPLRFVSEALGATVEWEAASQTIAIARGINRIQLQIGSKEAAVNKESRTLDAAPLIKEGLTMVPLRFIGESLNMKVAFDEGNITITEKK